MPRRYEVRISKEAFSGLQGIFDYIQQESPQNAPVVIERLLAAIEGLDFLPYRFKVHQGTQNPDEAVRSMPVPPYIVYYRVIESPGTVRILSVRHGARRQPPSFD